MKRSAYLLKAKGASSTEKNFPMWKQGRFYRTTASKSEDFLEVVGL